jgi:hypothetical protein
MLSQTALEAQLLRALNQFIEPIVRAGYGSPCITPTGLIVLETKGRRSGIAHSVPVFATLIDDHLLVATLRGERSHWMRNVRVTPDVRYWLDGKVRQATALALTGEGAPDSPDLPPLLRDMAASLDRIAGRLGIAFAILTPAP